MQILLKNVRLAFPELFEASTVNGEGDPAFSACFLLAKNDSQIKDIKAAIGEVAKSKWGAKAEATLKTIVAGDKTALHDGDLKAEYEGFEGMYYVSSRNKSRPTVVDRDRTPLIQADGRPYAGCYVNAIVELWAQDNNFGKRVNASLKGVQFVRDGDRFAGGGVASEDEFDDLTEGAEAELW